MITDQNPKFFNVLTGDNAPLREAIIVGLYDEIYRGTIGRAAINRAFVREIVLRAMSDYEWKSEEGHSEESIQSYASQTISRLIDEGWIEPKYDYQAMEDIFNFTRTGRKIAHALHQEHNRQLTTRQRNVRSTLKSLRAYRTDGDPYDLVDADEASESILSDLMDIINELGDARKAMVQKAMQNVQEASEGFFEFLEKDFRSSIAISLTEDSSTRFSNIIQDEIDMILSDEFTMNQRNARLIQRYPHLAERSSPVEDYLDRISNRIQTARETKIPELVAAFDSFMRSSEMALKQAGAIMVRRSSAITKLGFCIKQAEDEAKEPLIDAFASHLHHLNSRMLDAQRVRIRERTVKEEVVSVIASDNVVDSKELRRRMILSEYRRHIGYVSKEIEAKLTDILDEHGSIVNAFVPIRDYKDLLISLHAAAVAMKGGKFVVGETGRIVENAYMSMDEFVISKKEHE